MGVGWRAGRVSGGSAGAGEGVGRVAGGCGAGWCLDGRGEGGGRGGSAGAGGFLDGRVVMGQGVFRSVWGGWRAGVGLQGLGLLS